MIYNNQWPQIADELRIPKANKREERLQLIYYKYLISYDLLSADEKAQLTTLVQQDQQRNPPEAFGYPSGKNYSLTEYAKMADGFHSAWSFILCCHIHSFVFNFILLCV